MRRENHGALLVTVKHRPVAEHRHAGSIKHSRYQDVAAADLFNVFVKNAAQVVDTLHDHSQQLTRYEEACAAMRESDAVV